MAGVFVFILTAQYIASGFALTTAVKIKLQKILAGMSVLGVNN